MDHMGKWSSSAEDNDSNCETVIETSGTIGAMAEMVENGKTVAEKAVVVLENRHSSASTDT